MNATELIEQELLDAARCGRNLEEVTQRYGRSKGPYYHALAKATSNLQIELSDLSRSLVRGRHELESLREAGESLRAQQDRVKTEMAKAQEDLEFQRRQLAEGQPLLDQALELERLGFTVEHLRQLRDLLRRTAEAQGAAPSEGVAQFFATVAQYGEVTAWELAAAQARTRAKQAQAGAKRWQAEARRREASTKARSSIISIVERLLDAGATEGDLRAWEAVLKQTGTKPGDLIEELKTCGTWETVFQQRSEHVAALEARQGELQAEVEALRSERGQVSTAIGAVRDSALREMQHVSKMAQKAIDTLLARVQSCRELEVEAASLEAEVRLARALAADEQAPWADVSQLSIQRLLHGVLNWSLATDYNPTVSPPDTVRKGTLLQSYHKVPWRILVWWAITGLVREAEKLALKGS